MTKISKSTGTDFKNKNKHFSDDSILNVKADKAKKNMLSRTESDALTEKIMHILDSVKTHSR
jgi:hypothetical protein